jgi:hypothetical protein
MMISECFGGCRELQAGSSTPTPIKGAKPLSIAANPLFRRDLSAEAGPDLPPQRAWIHATSRETASTIGVALVLLLVALIPTAAYLILASRAKPTPRGACGTCGYDLRNLGDRRACPECGRPFRLGRRGDPVGNGRSSKTPGD